MSENLFKTFLKPSPDSSPYSLTELQSGTLQEWFSRHAFDLVIDYSQFLLYLSFSLSMILFFRRRLSPKLIAGAFALALVIFRYGENQTLGHLLLPEGANPQLVPTFLAGIAASGLTLLVVVRRWRTLDRIIMLGAQAAVIGTTLIFHVALVQTALPGWNWNIAWQHRNLLDLPSAEFQDGCKAEGVACWSGTSLRAEDFPAPLRGQIFGTYVDLSTRPFPEMGTTVGIDNDEKTGSIAAVLLYRKAGLYKVIVDYADAVGAHRVILRLFYVLCSVAHSIWIYLALFLIAFHHRRFSRRGHAMPSAGKISSAQVPPFETGPSGIPN
ncbi:hypothetical protein [Pseudomonas aeruginosa]|uniref:hypothetical protein n=1 Tax=Pseudomonas aeruginosa TaxID=287 RepID=UPI0019588FBA|nr:hypothetical protein [Pseudomonas aeruginosa]EJD6677598.1 hypothetical protein [Pseudomonas aeruginosa]ELR9159207.1 hypothetical protein [Pseudomonas aeruginosa]MBM7166013.1 hypothetical protein [Pseudomonas aeruginosa]MCS8481083.1 hypothetical protein [Pseudomonas aeruginosa]MCT1212727.1 hypothetical protein [Pseudomonas aeruginosa]